MPFVPNMGQFINSRTTFASDEKGLYLPATSLCNAASEAGLSPSGVNDGTVLSVLVLFRVNVGSSGAMSCRFGDFLRENWETQKYMQNT